MSTARSNVILASSPAFRLPRENCVPPPRIENTEFVFAPARFISATAFCTVPVPVFLNSSVSLLMLIGAIVPSVELTRTIKGFPLIVRIWSSSLVVAGV
ncbi:Uncharacterised protein [uncultured archaeon]|nr:Uncharacterised protein [uncultured archaeon]